MYKFSTNYKFRVHFHSLSQKRHNLKKKGGGKESRAIILALAQISTTLTTLLVKIWQMFGQNLPNTIQIFSQQWVYF